MREKWQIISKAFLLAAALVLSLGAAQLASARPSAKARTKDKTVYVCSCMKTKSCPCMTMATKEGKCACGAHSPEMKAVKRNSAWARTNRKALR